jgi:cold shock CspA family protein
MKTALQVTFRNLEPSELVKRYVQERAEMLEKYAGELIGCRVLIETPHRRHQQGQLFHVRIDVTLPGGEVVITRDPSADHAHEDVLVAVRDAFDAARRRVEDHLRRRRGHVKHHEATRTGTVTRLYPDKDYGFLETAEGRRVYFHRNAVLDGGFDRLEVGTRVTFAEEEGERGPQARRVSVRASEVGHEVQESR